MNQLTDKSQNFIKEVIRSGLEIFQVSENNGVLSFIFRVVAKPGSKKETLFLDSEGRLVIALSAKPVSGEANKALLKILGKFLGISTSKIILEKGIKSKIKQFRVSFAFTDHKGQDYYLKKWNESFK